MLTEGKAVISILIAVLFLTMIVLDFTIVNITYFLVLFYFMWKVR